MNCKHGGKMYREADGPFPEGCTCSVTRRRGFADGRAGHPPAEVTVDYLRGYEHGLKNKEER